MEPNELEYVPIDEDDNEHTGYQRVRPKWQHIPAPVMKYAAPFGRKWYKNRQERSKGKQLINLIKTEMLTQEWVDEVLKWGTEKRRDGKPGTRWSFDGFLNLAIDIERYRDWEIRRANATGSGGDITPDGTDLDAIDSHYGS